MLVCGDMSHAVIWGFVRRMAAVLIPLLLLPVAAIVALRALSRTPEASSSPTYAPASRALQAPIPAEGRTPEVRGRVFDADGNPVQGATVRLLSPSKPYKVLGSAPTESNGTFSFARAAPGHVRVVADHDPEGFASSGEVVAAEGESTAVTLVLSEMSGVRGTVVNGEQHPVAGATLSVEWGPWPVPSATSDDTGAFYLPLAPDEATTLVAVARGYRAAHVEWARREDRTQVVLRVLLVAGLPVDGDVRNVDGDPVRAQVVACAGQSFEARTTSAEDGTFQLPASTLGCNAIAERAGFAPSEPAMVVEGRRALLRLKTGGSIEGLVVDDGGSGVPSFTLGIESYSSVRGRGLDTGGRRAFEDPRGVFRWDNLSPGSYVLTASAAGKPPTRSGSIEVRGGVETRDVRIVLARGGSVTGRVYDDHRVALADVDVGFDAVSSVVDGNAATKTDAAGRYRLESAPEGPLTLRVQKAGFRVRLVSGLRVASGGTITEDVTLGAIDGGAGLELTGIGANLKLAEKGIELAAVGHEEPAERAGLQPGDRILSIDGESSDGMSVADAVQRLRGEAGATVGVTVERPKTGETIDVMMVRATIVR